MNISYNIGRRWLPLNINYSTTFFSEHRTTMIILSYNNFIAKFFLSRPYRFYCCKCNLNISYVCGVLVH